MIPADRKWFARTAAGAVIANALIDIDPRYPKIDKAAEAAASADQEASRGTRRRLRKQRQRIPSAAGRVKHGEKS